MAQSVTPASGPRTYSLDALLRRSVTAVAAILLFGGSMTLVAAPAAHAATVDYDCDESGPGEQDGTMVGSGCNGRPGNPEEGTHIVVEFNGYDWECRRVV